MQSTGSLLTYTHTLEPSTIDEVVALNQESIPDHNQMWLHLDQVISEKKVPVHILMKFEVNGHTWKILLSFCMETLLKEKICTQSRRGANLFFNP